MRIIRGLLFDLDGTLIDSKERFYESYAQALADFELPPISREAFERHYHLDELSRRLPEGRALREDFWHRFLKNLTDTNHETQFPIAGVKDALARLREGGYVMAVATARLCPEASVRSELDHLGMLSFFEEVLSHDRVAEKEGWDAADSTSKQMIIEEGAALLGLPASQTAFIGDWTVDIRSAKAAGCGMTIAVLSSGFKREILERESPDAIIDSAAELPDLLATTPDMVGPGYMALDREGRWLNDGTEITHTRTVELFWKSLSRNAHGRYVVRTGGEECPVLIHATPYFVRSIEMDAGQVTLRLSDGTEEPLDLATLEIVAPTYLHCLVKEGEHEARFGRNAYYELARHIEEDSHEGYVLKLAGKCYPVKRR